MTEYWATKNEVWKKKIHPSGSFNFAEASQGFEEKLPWEKYCF